MKSILERSSKYIPSTSMDMRKTFAKARREHGLEAKQEEAQKPITANIFSLEGR